MIRLLSIHFKRLFCKIGALLWTKLPEIYHPVLKGVRLQLGELFAVICITEKYVWEGAKIIVRSSRRKRNGKFLEMFQSNGGNLGTPYDTWEQTAKKDLENNKQKHFADRVTQKCCFTMILDLIPLNEQDLLQYLKCEVFDRPPNSPDLAPIYFLSWRKSWEVGALGKTMKWRNY